MKNSIILFYPKTEKDNVNRNTPTALLKIGSVLESSGYDVIAIDERFEENYEDCLRNSLDRAICLGVSVMTGYQIHGGLKASSFVKRMKEDIPVVWGGWHPSLLPEETLENRNIDIVVRGQGERTMLELVEALKNDNELEPIEGISYKKNGSIVSNRPREFQDVNSFQPLRFDLIDIERYIFKSPLGERSIFWNSSQGCPYRCGFCCTPTVFFQRWSGLNSDTLLEQLRTLVKDYEIDSVTFAEDNFFVDLERVKNLCQGLIKNNLKINWATDVRIDQLNRIPDDLMLLLKKSGCSKLYIGAESGDQEILDLIEKKIKLEDTYQAAEKLAKYDIVTDFFIVVGFPENPEKDLDQSLKLIKRVKSMYPDHQFTPLVFTPYPGIPLLDLSIRHGFKIPNKLEDWIEWSVLSVNTPWLSKKYFDRVNMYAKFLYPLAYPSESLNNKFEQKIKGFPYRVLHRMASWRIRKNFLNIPLEWKLLKIFHTARTKFKLFERIESFR